MPALQIRVMRALFATRVRLTARTCARAHQASKALTVPKTLTSAKRVLLANTTAFASTHLALSVATVHVASPVLDAKLTLTNATRTLVRTTVLVLTNVEPSDASVCRVSQFFWFFLPSVPTASIKCRA